MCNQILLHIGIPKFEEFVAKIDMIIQIASHFFKTNT